MRLATAANVGNQVLYRNRRIGMGAQLRLNPGGKV